MGGVMGLRLMRGGGGRGRGKAHRRERGAAPLSRAGPGEHEGHEDELQHRDFIWVRFRVFEALFVAKVNGGGGGGNGQKDEREKRNESRGWRKTART